MDQMPSSLCIHELFEDTHLGSFSHPLTQQTTYQLTNQTCNFKNLKKKNVNCNRLKKSESMAWRKQKNILKSVNL